MYSFEGAMAFPHVGATKSRERWPSERANGFQSWGTRALTRTTPYTSNRISSTTGTHLHARARARAHTRNLNESVMEASAHTHTQTQALWQPTHVPQPHSGSHSPQPTAHAPSQLARCTGIIRVVNRACCCRGWVPYNRPGMACTVAAARAVVVVVGVVVAAVGAHRRWRAE